MLLHYYNIYLIDKRIAKWKASPHPSLPPAEAGRRGSDSMYGQIINEFVLESQKTEVIYSYWYY